jgi:transmembrane sensor
MLRRLKGNYMLNDFERTENLLHIADLICGYQMGTLSEQQEAELNALLRADPLLKRSFGELSDKAQFCSDLEAINAFDPGTTLGKFYKIYPDQRTFKLWYKFVAFAAAVALIVMGIYFFNYNSNKALKQVKDNMAMHDVEPGKVGATLTLANGKKIRLANAAKGELAKEAGVVISKTADGKLVYEFRNASTSSNKVNTISTDNGEIYQVRLSDGSLVYLNAASSLTYTTSLIEGGKRTVRLQGEGYFEISKDKKHPFVVLTDNQQVEVLGTHFNINSYANEPVVATTLVEGSVKITSSNRQLLLKPGQQALNNGTMINITKANIENIMDWKDGDFYFSSVDFKTTMRKIARWYDVEIIYDSTVFGDIETDGWISRDKKLSSVLKFIESLGIVHFQVEGKKVYVSKK